MSKLIDEDEIGKVYSGLSIMAAAIPFASNPRKKGLIFHILINARFVIYQLI